MAAEIVWTTRAQQSFNDIIDYLLVEWGETSAEYFIGHSISVIDNIAEYPKIGAIEVEEKGIRGFLVTKHNRLFYRLSDDEVILLHFFDTRSGTRMPEL